MSNDKGAIEAFILVYLLITDDIIIYKVIYFDV
jgi:hypothetical protein